MSKVIRLVDEIQKAYHAKELALEKYIQAVNITRRAYVAIYSTWEEVCLAKEEMNLQYELMAKDLERVMERFNFIKMYDSARIETLAKEASIENQNAIDCFIKAGEDCESNNIMGAFDYLKEGNLHQKASSEIKSEINSLIKEFKKAEQEAMGMRKINAHIYGQKFKEAAENFEQAKANHESAYVNFEHAEIACAEAKNAFLLAQKKHTRLLSLLKGHTHPSV